MAQFGKADVGLIKATAGAEAGQFMDSGLMIGSAIGTAINAFSEQMKTQNAINAGLEKEVEDQFNVVTGNPSKQIMDHLTEITPGYKNAYVSNKGKDARSKQQRKFGVDDYNGVIQQIENITGSVQVSSEAGDFGPGANADHRYYNNMILSNNYLVETKIDPSKNNGYTQVNMAIPKKAAPDPQVFKHEESGNTVQGILNSQANNETYVLADHPKDVALIERYKTSQAQYKEWESKPDKVDGYYNTDKYQIYNSNNLPTKGENFENKTAALGYFNNNVSTKKNDVDLLNVQSTESYASGWEETVRGMNTSGVQLQHQIFGDFSDDGINNSFSSIFIDGVNSEKHPDMYNRLSGEPLEFSYGNKGETVEYDSNEWNGELTESERKQIKENFLRGYDTDGSINPDKNKEWIIKKYSAFMGQVTTDAFNAKRQQHFEQKGRFFDNGTFDVGGKYTSSDVNVFTSKEVANNNKSVAYNNTLTDIAFPKALLSSENLEDMLDDGGKIAKALEEVFEDHDGNFAWDFDDGEVTINGKNFNFTGDNKAGELEKMKKYLSDITLFEPNSVTVNNLTNSVDGSDWGELRDMKYDYHTTTRVGTAIESEDYSPFESSVGNLVTGKLEIVGISEDNKSYQVRDNNGITHSVPKTTLYPNQ